MFQVGDKVFYPMQGVGEIEGIIKKDLGEMQTTFFSIKIYKNQMTLLLPVQKIDESKIRALISRQDIDKIHSILKTRGKILSRKRNARYKQYMEKLKTGDTFKMTEVLRDLSYIREDTGLTPREKSLMDRVTDLIVQEIHFSLDEEMEKDEIIQDLKQHMAAAIENN